MSTSFYYLIMATKNGYNNCLLMKFGDNLHISKLSSSFF